MVEIISIKENGRDINPTYERKKLKVAAKAAVTKSKAIKKYREQKQKAYDKRMKSIHAIAGKFLKSKGSYKAMERKTIKLHRTPAYEGGRVALLNSGNGFFKR